MSAKLFKPGKGKTLCIGGWGRSGKDEAARTLHGIGPMKFCGSTSWQALPFLAAKLGVPPQIAWDERHNNRQFWKDYCDWLRRDDPALLIKLALEAGNIVSGIRDKVEIQAAIRENMFDAVLWITRPGVPEDPTFTWGPQDFPGCHVINNDGTLEQFQEAVRDWAYMNGFVSPQDIWDARQAANKPLTIP
jgi:hypothetical protein